MLHDVQVSKILAVPLANFAVFASFIYSIRDMVLRDPTETMDIGGMLWFVDLTIKDSTFFLPFSALGLSYLALDLALKPHGNVLLYLKDFFQSLMIISIPVILPLPAGIFFYWIPSSVFTIAQTQLLKQAAFRRLLRIPEIKNPHHLQPTRSSS